MERHDLCIARRVQDGGSPRQEVHGLQSDPLFITPAPIAQRPAAAPFNVAVNLGNYHLDRRIAGDR